MSKHTPGPWQIKINVSSACVLDGKGALLARLLLGNHGNDRVVANARLMTAAPDLLRALQEIHARLIEHPAYADLTEAEEEDIGGDTAELSYLARVARAAIAKAEGSA